ncbi:hypothetical protein EHQ94_08350 [Leptospira meyeri]|uniref:hypothetical protein n=1 Tax=Leptospira meyeri TaxID=29508 RepID=UPI0010837803|nr:hypothetical protein [Leptospira meyeri]TGM63420.1 hypothetical protein EHQ93_10255 [Leptospira meyeri]TGM70518.1 hypothetical protein EHQ94_08350 [Leptospira meyeri]
MPETPNYYSVKVNLRDEANMVYTMIAAVIDPVETKSVKFEGVSCTSPLSLLPVRSTFQDFYNRMQRVIYKGEQQKNITKSLQELIKTKFGSESFLEEILHYMDHNLTDRLDFVFSEIHKRTSGNTEPKVEIHFELIDPSEVSKTTVDEEEVAKKEAPPPTPVPQASGFLIPADKQIVQFKFQLSPVNGVPLVELKAGDNVYIRLVPGDAVTDSIINSLELKEESGAIKQIPAKIVNISNNKNFSEVVIKINEQIYGKIIEEENSVKIKTTDAQQGAANIIGSVASPTAAVTKAKQNQKLSADESFHLMPYIIMLIVLAIGMMTIFVIL